MGKHMPKIVIGIFILLAIYGIVNSFFISKKEKIFTIGEIYDRSDPGKRGRTYFFKYYIQGKEYTGHTDGLYKFTTNTTGLIYIDVLKSDFTQYHVLEFNKVPECLTLQDVPANGWDKLPGDTICK